MISFKSKGRFGPTKLYLEKLKEKFNLGNLNKYGEMGVEALRNNTPINTGKTRDSWGYEIEHTKGKSTIYWYNDNISNGYHVAIILQYGHATSSGSYVRGTDYINPAMKDVFQQIADQAWKEVNR